MANVEFGFMLRQKNDPGRSWQDLIAHNQTSINALTIGRKTNTARITIPVCKFFY